MTLFGALIIICIAGIIDGSFAGPSKHMPKWNDENIWFPFSVAGFLLFPIIYTSATMGSALWGTLMSLEVKYILIMLAGGLTFGIGQVFQCIAFRQIGLSITFVINISIGTAGVAIIPMLWHHEYIGTLFSYLQFGGSAVFVSAVAAGAVAGFHRDKFRNAHSVGENLKTSKTLTGIVFSILAGIGSASQGLSYAYVNPVVSGKAVQLFNVPEIAADCMAWMLIFNAAFVPYAIFYLVELFRNGSLNKFKVNGTRKYWLYIAFMGVCVWIPLVLFSKVADMLGGSLAPTVAWPLFMIFVVLTSNIWSLTAGEWKNAGRKAMSEIIVSNILCILAIVFFSVSSKYL